MPAAFHHKAEKLSMYARSKTVAASLCLVILATTLLFAQTPSKKAPAPDTNAQAEATKLIKEVYGDKWSSAKTPAEKRALAKKLLQKAKDTDNDQAGRFVLFRLSRDIATQAGDVTTAFQAVDEMGQSFQIDVVEMKAVAIGKFSTATHTMEQHKALAEKAIALLDEATSKDCFEVARQLVDVAIGEARKGRDPELIKRASQHVTEIEELSQSYGAIKEAIATLHKTPADPEANLTVGKYKCFSKGDWDGGLPMLALGSDETLKALAAKELAGAVSSDDQARLGDGWWSLAETKDGIAKKQVQERAAFWYRKALPGLSGLVKDKAEKRLLTLGPGTEPRILPRGVFAEAVVIWNTHNGKARDRGTLMCNLLLRSGGTTIWHKDKIKVPWHNSVDPRVIVKIPKLQFDALRIEVTDAVNGNGGLSEIEVYSAGKNIARGLPATTSATVVSQKKHENFAPSNVTDGITQSTQLGVGYWILPSNTLGWIEIDFSGSGATK